MNHRVEVLDQTGSGLPTQALAELVRWVLQAECTEGSVNVALVDEATIAALNTQYRDVTGPTDILSFPETCADETWPEIQQENKAQVEPEKSSESCAALGEIAVCPSIVARYAREDGLTFERQLVWTLIHGTLHLLGYDHECDQGQMRAREADLVECFVTTMPALFLAGEC